jgi:trimeric autotransporter adhesin
VRRASPAAAGVISTVAGGVGGPGKATNVAVNPCGVAFSGGYLYAGNAITVVTTVRQVSLSNDQLTTPVGVGALGPLGDGGPATKASLSAACGLAFDHFGNLVIADYGHSQVRVVAASSGTFYGQAMTAGHIYTVAGNGTAGFFGDGGAGTSAWLSQPSGVAMDGTNLLIADSGSNRIREVTG